jgi:hypothetical protein
MASKVDNLLTAFELVVSEKWIGTLSGREKIWFLIYDPSEQRKISLRKDDFETATKKAGKRWASVSVKNCFPEWMSKHDYHEEYFADPSAITDQLETEFKQYVSNYLVKVIEALNIDENTLVVIEDVAALFGLVRLSEVLSNITHVIKGRLMVFFPGEFDKNNYRLLNARDGWSYLARPITA